MLAAVAAGEYRDLSEAVNELVAEAAVLEPETAVVASYREQQQRYRMLRSAMVAEPN
jgi:sugar (pentulose or hexulose) kinase